MDTLLQRIFRRKKYIVNRMQALYVAFNALFVFSYTVLIAFCIFLPTILTLFSQQPLGERLAAANLFLNLSTRMWPVLLFGFPVYILLTIFYSHKVFGPMDKICQFVGKIHSGDYSARIRLRQGDVMFDVMNTLNESIIKVEADKKYNEEMRQKIKAEIAIIKQELAKNAGDGKNIDRLKQQITGLEIICDNKNIAA